MSSRVNKFLEGLINHRNGLFLNNACCLLSKKKKISKKINIRGPFDIQNFDAQTRLVCKKVESTAQAKSEYIINRQNFYTTKASVQKIYHGIS